MTQKVKIIFTIAVVILAILAVQKFTAPTVSGGPRAASDIPLPDGAPESVTAKEKQYERAKEFAQPGGFINSEPFTMASLTGNKVILVDFWTYSCINCQRTIPYLNDWYAKYHDKGLEIVGVHTPEFAFEKNIDNVKAAVAKFGIRYPVVQDNDFGTWRAYRNQYWPRKYLVDTDGFIVYDHIGEGGYEETEKRIQEALAEHMARSGMQGTAAMPIRTPGGAVSVDFEKVGTPEMYFGASRNDAYFGNGEGGTVGRQTLTMPPVTDQTANVIYLAGQWEFADEYARCVSDCRVRLLYEARQVNLVAGSTPAASVHIWQDGVQKTAAPISGTSLYHLIDDTGYGEHQLELEISPGVDLYTFTFG